MAQTLLFLPHFISAVLIGLIAYNILSYDYGLLNHILGSLGMDPVKVYSNTHVWPFIIVITYLWQTTGYGSIVYFATIMGLDGEIIEASEIDGANAFQRIIYIVIPWLKPTFIIFFALLAWRDYERELRFVLQLGWSKQYGTIRVD